ncbi:gfo/Idh/MocA family oxidoreductase, partial [Chloroflexi bacterium TSY]|nr:gfo/Idh/MocA family oxidoreductase [Chloroflexi bacterium TSY]
LSQTETIVQAGKHVWYDKPAGEDWAQWQRVVALAKERELLIQMGYMFRYHDGFNSIAEWVHSGFLGNIFSVRAHMSTNVAAEQMGKIGVHQGGIFFDLGGHMLDQIVYL